MITIQTLTPLQQVFERIDEPIRRIENRTVANIHDLNDSFNAFWSQSDEAINEILAFKGVIEITKIFTAHYEYGVAFNKLLEERGIGSPRAVLIKPRELTMDGNGNLILVPLPSPVIEEPIIE